MSRHQQAFLKSMPPMGTKRRVLSDFTLDEISAVDRPAQKGAVVTIIKREDDEMRKHEPASFGSFEEACSFLKSRGASDLDAMRTAARQHPDLLAKYQSEPPAIGDPPLASRQTLDRVAAAREFEDIVDRIAARDNLARHVAMSRARRSNPEVFRSAFPESE